jgi:hypothetical protein
MSKKKKTKAIQTTKNQEKEDQIYLDSFKKTAINTSQLLVDPKTIEKEGAEMIKEYFGMRKGAKKDEFRKEIENKVIEYSKAMSLDTNIHALNGIDFKMGGMALQMISELKKEYDIKTPQDKAYLQIAVSAFCRYHSNMNEFKRWKNHDWNSHERCAYMGMLSKDADKAFRQYHSIIQYFEAKKNPPLHVNVKTKTAFIAQNQQNIATNQDQDENNAPK